MAFLRLALRSQELIRLQRIVAFTLLVLLGCTLVLGRSALAWREGRSRHAGVPRFHRAAGTLSLVGLALAVTAWLLRRGF